LLESLNDWTLYFQDKHQAAIAYTNFSRPKAFDVVCHKKLFARLFSYGIRGVLLSWLQQLFTGRSYCTKVRRSLSEDADLLSGVIQGSVIGPLTFLISIDELVDILDSFGIEVKVFADNFKLYIRISNEVDVTTLQEALNFLFTRAEKWQLSLSLDKCYVFFYLRSVDLAVSFYLVVYVFLLVMTWVLASLAICLPLYIYMIMLPKLSNDPTTFTVASCLEMLVY